MLAHRLGRFFSGVMYAPKLIVRLRLTDDERIPVVVSAQDEMRRDGSALQWAMQFDFQQFAQLRGDVKMRVVCIQPDITTGGVLTQLDRMPAVRRLEAGETTGMAQLLRGEKPFEGFAEPIRQCLDRRGRHSVSAAPLDSAFEARRQVVLRWEGGRFLIL